MIPGRFSSMARHASASGEAPARLLTEPAGNAPARRDPFRASRLRPEPDHPAAGRYGILLEDDDAIVRASKA
jgi:hypothetical protein